MNNFNKTIKIISLVCLSLALSSCELLGPKKAKKIPLTPVLKEQPAGLEDSVVFQELKNKDANSALQSKIEMFPARDRFAPKTESFRRTTKSGGPGTYSLNFDDADLGEVAKVILSDILGQNYVLSPKVTGKVTLNTTEPLTKEELIPTLEMVLRMNNAALVKDGKIYHIEPSGDALYSSTVAGASSTGFQSRVIPIRNVAAQEIADILKPLVHEKTILNVDSSHNSITAQGTADELARIMDIVSTFDIDVLRGRSFALFPLNHADPEKVIDELETIFDLSEKEDGSFFRFLPIERMNAVLAITHQASYLRDVENWIYRLDRANTESGGGVTVYRVQHMDAEELADTLNEIFTGAGPRDKSAKVAAGRKSAEASNKTSDDGQQADATGSATGAATGTSSRKKKSSKSTTRSKSSSGGGNKDNDISIVADIANNSLIITATPQEMNKIMPVIKQLDIMPLQVLIDATIAEVTLKDDLEYGIQWYFNEGKNFAAARGIGSPLSTQLVDAAKPLFKAAAAVGTGGLSTIYDAGDIKMLLRAQAILNNTKVISSPSLMVLNNQEATINVGDEVPAPSASTQVPIAGGGNNTSIAQSNTIQYLKTGVTLEVTPRVNSSGLVILDISQEVKNAVKTQSSDIDAPTIQNKEISSIVAVKDGETLALGGLIRDQNDNLKTGIPFLHELPLIGPLFGSNNRNENRTELVVLITPRVVKTKQDARVVTNEFKHKLSGMYYDPRYPKKKGDWWRARDW